MQDALGGKAIHAALRSLTNICSGLLNCGAESVPSGCDVPIRARTLSSLSFRSRNVRWCAKAFSIARKRSSDATGLVRKSSAPALIARTVVGNVGIASEEYDRQR